MNRNEILKRLDREKIIAIVRGVPADRIVETAKAVSMGGIYCLEVAFDHTTNKGIEETLESIRLLKLHPELNLLIGAGTVLSSEEVVRAREAGAEYIVSPDTNPDVIRLTRNLGMVSIPGAYTPTEAVRAFRYGGDIIKLFPAGVLGTAYFKAIMEPLGYMRFAAVGNIDAGNIHEFLKIGISNFGIGGSLIDKKAIQEGGYEKLTINANTLVQEIEKFRNAEGA